MERKKLFNPEGDKDFSNRRMIGGNTTNLFELNDIKYGWATKLYRALMNNFWIPEEIPLGADQKDYRELSDSEKAAFDKVISFLVFLDSLQTHNLPNISDYITAPEVNLILAIQTYQEAIHSESYGYILDTVVTSSKRKKIYNYWRDDKILRQRNEIVTSAYEYFIESPSEDNFARVLMANYCLEGIYFYSGFSFFYCLARQNKMNGTAQVIRYIQRDEVLHMVIFQNIIRELQQENPELYTPEKKAKMLDFVREAVEGEIAWGQYVIKDGILGLSDELIDKYIKYLANKRMEAIGFGTLYPEIKEHPLSWVESYSNVNGIKTDFFEAKPTSYSKSSENMDWDDL